MEDQITRLKLLKRQKRVRPGELSLHAAKRKGAVRRFKTYRKTVRRGICLRITKKLRESPIPQCAT